MTARRVALLFVAALAVIGFAMWMASTRHLERDKRAGDLVLPGLEQAVNAVTAVDLVKGDGTRTTLKKGSDGWSVAERGWPADSAKLRKLVLDLGALNIVEEKTRLPANYPQLGVEDITPQATGTRIDAIAPGRSWALIVGKTSNAKSGYVRVVSTPQSLLAAPLLMPDTDPRSWLDHTLIDLSAARVREVAERPADGPAYTATRLKKDEPAFSVSPLPKGRALTGPAAAEPIAAALSMLTLDDVQKASVAGDTPQSHAVFSTFDGLAVEIVGRKDGARSMIAISAHASGAQSEAEAQKLSARLAGYEFEIPQYRYAALFKPLEELLQRPVEPLKKTAGAKPK
jgi:hypothetical protein